MNSSRTPARPTVDPRGAIPRWLHAAVKVVIVLQLALVLALVIAYLMDSGAELALVVLILAGLFALPLALTAVLYAVGIVQERRRPALAVACVLAGAIAGGLGGAFAAWFVLATWLAKG